MLQIKILTTLEMQTLFEKSKSECKAARAFAKVTTGISSVGLGGFFCRSPTVAPSSRRSSPSMPCSPPISRTWRIIGRGRIWSTSPPCGKSPRYCLLRHAGCFLMPIFRNFSPFWGSWGCYGDTRCVLFGCRWGFIALQRNYRPLTHRHQISEVCPYGPACP